MENKERKRRGRPTKKSLSISGDLILDVAETQQTCESDNETVCDTASCSEDTTSCENVNPEFEDRATTLSDFINLKTTFEYDGITWTPHKYNIGDKVYVPVDQVVNNGGVFSPINAVLCKVPKKLTVGSVVYTNRVSYTFRETSKIIASENFVCADEESCLLLCKELS